MKVNPELPQQKKQAPKSQSAQHLKTETNQAGRILIVEDKTTVYSQLQKILGSKGSASDQNPTIKKGETHPKPSSDGTTFTITSVRSGKDALDRIQEAQKNGTPYTMVFVVPTTTPGKEALKTISTVLHEDPALQIILCTEHQDYRWDEILKHIGETDRLLILKNPLEPIDTLQLVHALQKKWMVNQQNHLRLKQAEAQLLSRTRALRAVNHRLKDEVSGRERIEMELRLAQKLEAVGQLAAGIAHEINTPIQFIGDNVHFLKTSFDDYLGLISKYQEACRLLSNMPEHQTLAEEIEEEEEITDLDFLQERVPRAFERAFEGLERVTTIVQAMKEFSHPDQREKVPTDLNNSISNTLTVATNEYKYVAEIETDFGDIPPVTCLGGDVNQVFLNLIVNAAHAIADIVKDPEEKGKIWIKTEKEDAHTVLITIRDSGSGIPEDIRQRIFDPFFTTKGVGKGTGQGLAIARSVIVDKHNGTMSLESNVGEGTTFFIRLPINGNTLSKEEAA